MIITSEGARIRVGDGPWIPVTGCRMEFTPDPPAAPADDDADDARKG